MLTGLIGLLAHVAIVGLFGGVIIAALGFGLISALAGLLAGTLITLFA